MTLILKPEFLPTKASMLTLISGMAVCQGIREKTNLKAMIKWPNDIVVNGKKICGILTEMSSEMEAINYIITGIGINVNNEKFPSDIADKATSIKLETQKTFRRSDIIASVIKHFRNYYDTFLKTVDLSLLKEEYNSLMINTGKKVFVVQGNKSYEAVAKSIDNDGELIIEKDGQISRVISGEVSVRGVYGYV